MNIYEKELSSFRKLNQVAQKGGIVLFGSSFAREIPVCELKQSFHLDCDIYNRSLTDLSVFDAGQLLDSCVLCLEPRKVLVQLGETDLERGCHTIPEIIAAYEEVVTKLKAADRHCDIVLVSVGGSSPSIHSEELNQSLKAMAKKTKCKYADISCAFTHDSPSIKAFHLLEMFLWNKFTFYDAMTLVNV